MRVAIHQPQYWPWPPYIHKVMSADIFVYLDTVQFSKNGFQNRNQIKTANGASWLTLPARHHFGQKIFETMIAEPSAPGKHFKTLAASYAHTGGYQRWKDELYALLHKNTEALCEIAISSTEWMLEKLGIRTRRLRASEIPEAKGQGSALIASICEVLGATSYVTGVGALDYMNREDFSGIRCAVLAQEWKTFMYPQAHPEIGFIQDLSTLDLLLNCPDTAMPLIQSAGSWKLLWDTI